jgi:hypothetical protein
MAVIACIRALYMPIGFSRRDRAIVTSTAGFWRPLEYSFQMTACTLHRLMLSGQRKPCVKVIKDKLFLLCKTDCGKEDGTKNGDQDKNNPTDI